MTHRSKHMPYYILCIGLLMLSVGYNLVLSQQNKDLRQDRAIDRVIIEYLYLREYILQK